MTSVPEVDALPGHAHAGHRVDEAACPGADALHTLGRRRRRHQQDGVDARRIGFGRPGTDLLDREVGDDAAGDPGRGQRARHALVAGSEDKVVIGHDRDRHRGLGPCDAVEDLVGHRARWSARTAASWITGPSIIGSENGMPTSTASAPAATIAASDCVQSSVMPPMR